MIIKRGDIFYADLSPVIGSEQGGLRPVLIIQNDVGNKYSPTVIAAAITSRMGKTRLPTHIDIYAEKAGLAKDSVILLEQIRTLDKRRLKEKIGHLDDAIMNEVNAAIAISFGLDGIIVPEETYEPAPPRRRPWLSPTCPGKVLGDLECRRPGLRQRLSSPRQRGRNGKCHSIRAAGFTQLSYIATIQHIFRPLDFRLASGYNIYR